eukprot:CAMPEP_0184300260 /NCGR_PEP_ID=MMETSP1049-20130417/10709_1 /TAXON_ID=77928 /ORGANISM="Proteomonas sulcata, Strain CCMP704" /LENGTH=82 /DNA_ID=CAMNT_0026610929 /DNA_START=184 /DNA_END=429 /DNA_ORIENTATION=+
MTCFHLESSHGGRVLELHLAAEDLLEAVLGLHFCAVAGVAKLDGKSLLLLLRHAAEVEGLQSRSLRVEAEGLELAKSRKHAA